MTSKCLTCDTTISPLNPPSPPPQPFNHLAGLFSFVLWTNYFGTSLWESSIQACETYETNPKIVRGVGCGGKLGFYVCVAGVGYLVCGYVVGGVLALFRCRGGKATENTGLEAEEMDQEQLDRRYRLP